MKEDNTHRLFSDRRASASTSSNSTRLSARGLTVRSILRTAGKISLYLTAITLGLFLLAFVAYLVAS